MPTAEQSGTEFMTLAVAAGLRPGRTIPTVTTGAPLNIAGFPGELQGTFLAIGGTPATNTPPTYQLADLVAGLGYAVAQGWLSLGNAYGQLQEYVLEQAGFAEAGGVAPSLEASGQQLINVCVNTLGMGAGTVPRMSLAQLVKDFIGTTGGNTFAAEDLIGGYGYAFSQGWVRPCGDNLFDPVFTLTGAGVAAAT